MFNKILRFQEVLSTQDVAKKFIDKKEEIVVVSLKQRKGRGRQRRLWFSPLGGLYISLLLFPQSRHNVIPLIAALGVIKVLETLKFNNISILWPNDVLLNNKKVCGILCERYKDGVVCGIGLNVNVKRFPKNLVNATSLLKESQREFNLEDILKEILKNIEVFYLKLQEGGLNIQEIYSYLSGIGEMVEISLPNGIIKGTVYGIDNDWSLLLREESGIIKKFYYGDVRRVVW